MQKQSIQTIDQKEFKSLLCQINPFHKNSKNSIDRVQRSLKKYDSKSQIDIVMFPQMAFIGYNFENFQDALPYGHFQMEGEQFEFAIQQAKRLKSYFGFGYIEKVKVQSKQNEKQQIHLYNSVAIIDKSGSLMCNYRKSHLYYNDQLWAKQGTGFVVIQLKNHKGQAFRCTPIICMDINPKNFTSGQFEVANFIVQNDIEVMLMFTNWVDSTTLDIQKNQVMATYNYWLHRLDPVLKSKRQRLLLFCDRCGYEHDVFANKKIQFYGSSVAIMVNPIYIIKNLDIQNEGYLMIQTKLPKVQLNPTKYQQQNTIKQ